MSEPKSGSAASVALQSAIRPALSMLPASMGADRAHVMLVAIGLQESRLIHRRQIGGPARGLWQFEEGGGVKGVLTHPSSKDLAFKVCLARGVTADRRSVYAALEHDDILAAAFARLLLWTDPKPLPTNEQDGWALYLRTWRPGKPHPETWSGSFSAASEAVNES